MVKGMYRYFIKRLGDIVFSLLFLIIIFMPLVVIGIIIYCQDPGPVIFKQKRVGKDKRLFTLYKFRSMRLDTPSNIPTHLLENPQQYILKIGKFIRKTSIDELPQLVNILKGDMSFIGPRPALYNQDDLVAERERHGANDIRPGLTGLAQISGRDELEIPVKARFDGEYVKSIKKGWFRGVFMDLRCFFGSIKAVLRHDGVVEGKQENKNEQESKGKQLDNQTTKGE